MAETTEKWPTVTEGDFMIENFMFNAGCILPQLKLHYRTLGELKKDENGRATNAVLVMHGTGGSGAQFICDQFAGELFGPGQLLDAQKYFIVLRDGIGHGDSSKPSDGLRAKFPRYGYTDIIHGDHELLTKGLGINHLRLVMGTSMGGMHSWLWAYTYPDFMDAVLPLASLPLMISGRNRMLRKMVTDSIRGDPQWNEGNYEPGTHLRGVTSSLYVLLWMGSCPLQMQEECPDRESADAYLDDIVATGLREKDPNDLAYAFDASFDYNPSPHLDRIKAPLLAVNFADDQVNPPELGILEREVKKIPRGQAITMPITKETRGHGTHTKATVWIDYLRQLLDDSSK